MKRSRDLGNLKYFSKMSDPELMYFMLRYLHRKGVYTSVLPLKLSSDQEICIFISLFKPSEHDLHAILFHFASRIRWANFEREDYKNIKELYAWSTKGREVIGNCILNNSRRCSTY